MGGIKKSQAQQTDVRLRLYGGVDTDITKQLNAGLEYEHRFDKFLSSFEKAFIEPSLAYSFNKKFRIGANYRLALSQNNMRNQKIQNRTSAYVQYRLNIDDFRIRFRTILQYGFDDISSATYSFQNKLINRNSVQVDYEWFGKKIRPFAKYEFFYHINHPQGGIINQQRVTAGTKYSFSKAMSIDLFYMFENEMNIVAPSNSHILGFGFGYSF